MKYYVLCPYGYATGGPDALHQMVYYLRSLNLDAVVAYDIDIKGKYEVLKPYQIYGDNIYIYIDKIEDSPENVLILPETWIYKIKKFKKCKKYIWWLSVDNNFINANFTKKMLEIARFPLKFLKHICSSIEIKVRWNILRDVINAKKYLFKNEDDTIFHICASYYAFDYVSHQSERPCLLCIEPISKHFLEIHHKENDNNVSKENCILYNPAKCQEFVSKLIKANPDLNFIPLKKMTQDELVQQYKKSKLYIDFGPFPGAERMPKEAVLFGCNILTGKFGASNYYGDVPIPDEYKIDATNKNIPIISKKIRNMLSGYDTIYKDFDVYRNTVLFLEESFIETLKNIFNCSDK